jgi:hypothetical protein
MCREQPSSMEQPAPAEQPATAEPRAAPTEQRAASDCGVHHAPACCGSHHAATAPSELSAGRSHLRNALEALSAHGRVPPPQLPPPPPQAPYDASAACYRTLVSAAQQSGFHEQAAADAWAQITWFGLQVFGFTPIPAPFEATDEAGPGGALMYQPMAAQLPQVPAQPQF